VCYICFNSPVFGLDIGATPVITEFIIQVFFSIITGMFSVFPAFPAMPSLIVTSWEWFIVTISAAQSLLVYLLSPPLYIITITLIIFMTTFDYIYHFFIRFLIFRIVMGVVGR